MGVKEFFSYIWNGHHHEWQQIRGFDCTRTSDGSILRTVTVYRCSECEKEKTVVTYIH